MQDTTAHIRALKQRFPRTVFVQKSTSASTLLTVEERIVLSPSTQHTISLLVVLPASFPGAPPRIMLPDGETEVPITPSDATAAEWNGQQGSLVDAVANAFLNVAAWWGPVASPSLTDLAPQLRLETDTLLHDLIDNDNCLDAYCYQLPVVKEMREVEKSTVDELETAARENEQLREQVDQLRTEVQQLQSNLRDEVDKLRAVSTSNTLLSAVADPQTLLRTLETDVRKMSTKCATLGKAVLLAYASDKREFQERLAEYKATAKRMHMLQLKYNIYKTQLNH